ncbi:unnamed protein product, partial [Linum tenue]
MHPVLLSSLFRSFPLIFQFSFFHLSGRHCLRLRSPAPALINRRGYPLLSVVAHPPTQFNPKPLLTLLLLRCASFGCGRVADRRARASLASLPMMSRGRGRGRGSFGRSSYGGGSLAKQEPYILFPEVKLPDPKNVKEEKGLVVVNAKFQAFWKASCYYLEENTDAGPMSELGAPHMFMHSYVLLNVFCFLNLSPPLGVLPESWIMEVERFPDRAKPKVVSKRGSLDEFLQFGSDYFPKELVGGKKVVRRSKKPRWQQALDVFENLENKEAKKKAEGGQETKEGEEEEDEEEVEAIEEEEFSDDDYNQHFRAEFVTDQSVSTILQNEYFDDDEDDFNVDAADDGGVSFTEWLRVSMVQPCTSWSDVLRLFSSAVDDGTLLVRWLLSICWKLISQPGKGLSTLLYQQGHHSIGRLALQSGQITAKTKAGLVTSNFMEIENERAQFLAQQLMNPNLGLGFFVLLSFLSSSLVNSQ